MNQVPLTMKAWTKTLDERGGFTLEDHPIPKPVAGEVLIQTRPLPFVVPTFTFGNGMIGVVRTYLLELSRGMKQAGRWLLWAMESHLIPLGIWWPLNATLLVGLALVAMKGTLTFARTVPSLVSTATGPSLHFSWFPPSMHGRFQRGWILAMPPFKTPWVTPFTR